MITEQLSKLCLTGILGGNDSDRGTSQSMEPESIWRSTGKEEVGIESRWGRDGVVGLHSHLRGWEGGREGG